MSPVSGSPHSPPIFKTPNRFFDSLTEADRARTRIGLSASSSGRHSLNTSNAATPLASSPVGSAPKTSPPIAHAQEAGPIRTQFEPNSVELQFQAECIAPFAHNGYVVSLVLLLRVSAGRV